MNRSKEKVLNVWTDPVDKSSNAIGKYTDRPMQLFIVFQMLCYSELMR